MEEAHAIPTIIPTFQTTLYCGARCKQHNHRPCKQPAMANGRCRLHGGKSPIKNGNYTKSAISERKEFRLFFNRMKSEALENE